MYKAFKYIGIACIIIYSPAPMGYSYRYCHTATVLGYYITVQFSYVYNNNNLS